MVIGIYDWAYVLNELSPDVDIAGDCGIVVHYFLLLAPLNLILLTLKVNIERRLSEEDLGI